MPEVSVIIPTFNRADYLTATMKSVQDQTFSDWECLIIDDGSTDNSYEIINQFLAIDKRFIFFSRTETNKPKGVSSCRNIGINHAKGNYIIFLDSDDLLLRHCLSSRLKYAQESPESHFYLFKMQVLKNGKLGRVIGEVPENSNRESYIKMIFEGIQPMTVTSILWKNQVLQELSGFDENLARLEDPDLHLRAFYKGFDFSHDSKSEPDCHYRVDDTYQEKFDDKTLLTKICDSFLFFTEKHSLLLGESNIFNTEQSKTALKKWALHFYKEYFLRLNDWSMYSKFFKLVQQIDLLLVKERFKGRLIALYNLLGLNKIKGLGYYRLQKKFFN